MTRIRIVGFYLSLILISISSQSTYCQLSKSDSLILKSLQAIKILDTINSPLPDSIRQITFKYFIANGLNPSDYYTFDTIRLQRHNEKGYIEYFKIGALRDKYILENSDVHKVGAYGGSGDDIIVIYNKTFKVVYGITNAE